MKAGETLHAASPGGGGFGDPLTRDPAAVERDVRLCYVSPATAERLYGAVMDGGRLDIPATESAQT